MLWKLLVILFLLSGAGVAAISLYNISIEGTMNKLGLVGSDFDVSVDTTQLEQKYLMVESGVRCGITDRLAGAAQLLISADDRQGELAFRLGRDRIKCGAVMMAAGLVESGTYEVIKGIGYIKEGYAFVEERAELDYRVCRYLPEAEVFATMEDLLLASKGKVYELLLDRWGEVMYIHTQVGPVCLEQRESVR